MIKYHNDLSIAYDSLFLVFIYSRYRTERKYCSHFLIKGMPLGAPYIYGFPRNSAATAFMNCN
jgi:hypothetical protein